MKKCMDCNTSFDVFDDECCLVCGSPDIVDVEPEEEGHYEGGFSRSTSKTDDREE